MTSKGNPVYLLNVERGEQEVAELLDVIAERQLAAWERGGAGGGIGGMLNSAILVLCRRYPMKHGARFSSRTFCKPCIFPCSSFYIMRVGLFRNHGLKRSGKFGQFVKDDSELMEAVLLKRRRFSAEFKRKVVLEAMRGDEARSGPKKLDSFFRCFKCTAASGYAASASGFRS